MADESHAKRAKRQAPFEKAPAQLAFCFTADNRRGQCKPPTLCIGMTGNQQEINRCVLEGGEGNITFGVCCSSVTKNSGHISFVKSGGEPKVKAKVSPLDVFSILKQR